MTGKSKAVGGDKNNVQIIKQMICLRAKYRKGSAEDGPTILSAISPSLVIPHPENRGGDPVRSLRTKQLSSQVSVDGCDVFEANASAVCVEEHPSQAEGVGILRWQSYQDNFEKQVAADHHIAKSVNGIRAGFGSLSHSHFNCLMRNMLMSMKGCECKEGGSHETSSHGDGDEVPSCECKNRPLLDEQGRYSMERLEQHDTSWATLCHKGIRWEVLSHKLDVEEPLGAKVISLALNKKNDAAMATTHEEIMTTLVGLCKPSPDGLDGQVPFEPVRDKMLEWYGTIVDHPDFLHAFRLVMDAGGHESPHMQDLQQFTTIFVNPNLRKMRFDTYGVVAVYPIHFPRIKNACIKWSYKQPTILGGWCTAPPNIAGLLDEGGKFSMHRGDMLDIEHTFREMSKCALALTVKGQEGAKKRASWIAEVEVGVMKKVFALLKSASSKNFVEECVFFLGQQLLKLVDGDKGRIQDMLRQRTSPPPSLNQILDACFKLAVQEDFVLTKKGQTNPKAPERENRDPVSHRQKSAVAEAKAMVPTVTKQDEDGAPLVNHAPRDAVAAEPVVKRVAVEVIDWERWLLSQHKDEQIAVAKSVLTTACRTLNASLPNPNIAMVRKPLHTNSSKIGTKLCIKASQDFDVNQLAIPLQFRKASALIGPDDHSIIHPNAVKTVVSWPITEEDKLKGIEHDSEDC